MIESRILSSDPKRNKVYSQFLSSSAITVKNMIKMGDRLMRKSKLHRHFFFKPTFLERLFGPSYMRPTAKYLTYFALNLPYEHNHACIDKVITKEEAKKVIALFEKRISERCPVEYITNECVYLNRKFYVNPHVLVPRSLMNTRFADFLAETHWENYRVLDLCTGSGCIGITLALINPNIKVDLADISAEALKVANINIQRYNLQDRVRCIESDLFANITDQYDLIISNPPYVASKVVHRGPAELKQEPNIALDGGADGLIIVDRMLQQAKNYLNRNGKLIVEVGFAAPKHLKKRYPKTLTWLSPKPAPGEKALFDCWLTGPCMFVFCNEAASTTLDPGEHPQYFNECMMSH